MGKGRGAFIAFEGGDRSGKTTQAKLAVSWIQETLQQPAALWHFPDRTSPVGKLLDAYLSGTHELEGHVAHLLFAANRWERSAELRSLIERGVHVLVDRYAYSGVAFSVAARSLDLDWCMAADRGLPAPDAVLFFDLDPEIACTRGGFGQERYERLALQQQVRNVFQNQLFRPDRWKRICAAESAEQVQAQCQQIIAQVLSQIRETPLDEL
jgi:dTMP kinase